MSQLINNIDQRTNLVGQNRLELLLFRLQGATLFGINVFKVREVLPCPSLGKIPGAQPQVLGITHLRGEPVSVIDLSAAIGTKAMTNTAQGFLLVTEYNRHVQAFLVAAVERIVNMNWTEMQPPPTGIGAGHYLTAVCRIDGRMVQVIDVEKIFQEISPQAEQINTQLLQQASSLDFSQARVLVVDDSAVARNQVKRALESMGIQVVTAVNGAAALDYLEQELAHNPQLALQLPLIISDIEMPQMDGYTLTAQLKQHAQLKTVPVLLHSSLSGVFNEAMVQKAGADQFIAKFHPDELAAVVQKWLTAHNNAQSKR